MFQQKRLPKKLFSFRKLCKSVLNGFSKFIKQFMKYFEKTFCNNQFGNFLIIIFF